MATVTPMICPTYLTYDKDRELKSMAAPRGEQYMSPKNLKMLGKISKKSDMKLVGYTLRLKMT